MINLDELQIRKPLKAQVQFRALQDDFDEFNNLVSEDERPEVLRLWFRELVKQLRDQKKSA